MEHTPIPEQGLSNGTTPGPLLPPRDQKPLILLLGAGMQKEPAGAGSTAPKHPLYPQTSWHPWWSQTHPCPQEKAALTHSLALTCS